MQWQDLAEYLLPLIPCIIVSNLCVMGKFSFVQLRREAVEEMARNGDRKAPFLLKLYEKPALFLGTAQVGMVTAGMASGAGMVCVFYHF